MSVNLKPEELSELLKFEDNEPVEVPVKVKQKDGSTANYILKEGMEEVNAKYQNYTSNMLKVGSDGKIIGVTNPNDAKTYLLSLCLFEVVESTKPGEPRRLRAVPNSLIRSWPTDRVSKLFEIAKKINHVDEEETLESIDKQIERLQEVREAIVNRKNEQSAATDISE